MNPVMRMIRLERSLSPFVILLLVLLLAGGVTLTELEESGKGELKLPSLTISTPDYSHLLSLSDFKGISEEDLKDPNISQVFPTIVNNSSRVPLRGVGFDDDDDEREEVTVNFGSQWILLLEALNDTNSPLGLTTLDKVFGEGAAKNANETGSRMLKGEIPLFNPLMIACGLVNVGGVLSRNYGTLVPSLDGKDFDDFLLVPKELFQSSLKWANQRWTERQRKIDDVFDTRPGADSKSPIGTAYAFSPANAAALALSNHSILLEFASRALLTSLEGSEGAEMKSRVKRQTVLFTEEDEPSLVEEGMIKVQSSGTGNARSFNVVSFGGGEPDSMTCGLNDEVLPCDPKNPYRTYSGWCNNLQNPGWGKSVITFDRMIPSAYADGVSLPRSNSVTGHILPSPRSISSYIHIDASHLSSRYTLMLMQFAQFLDHDITLTPVQKGPSEKILNCRDCLSQAEVHPECWPIPVMPGDKWYPATTGDKGKPNCIPFTRSLPGQQRLGPREQINQNSAHIDASQIYGESVCKAETLRIGGGKLNMTVITSAKKGLLPQTSSLKECKSPSGYCFYAGDPRASEQPALAALHVVFHRQHNQWADELKAINPHWNDEHIYQQVRKLMGAVSQHITYNEFLPRILGPTMINAYGLGLQSEGYYAGYDATCPTTIYNEFATAAFRFGHSLIRPQLARMDAKYNGMSPHIQLRDGFFNSDMLLKPLMVDEILRGLLGEPMEEMDPFVTNEITEHLFEDKKKSFSGLDLISLNIHRGRDHGFSGYNNYRTACNLKKAKGFQDLASEVNLNVIQRLQKIYSSVDDIDLFTGSMVERAVTGGILGPTMTCILGSQFKRLRKCDRYWYETNDPALKFTAQQLAEIRKVTLSKIVCDNMDVPSDIQRWSFDAPNNALNPRLPCNRLARLNLELWKDAPSVGPVTVPSAPVKFPVAEALTAPKGESFANTVKGGCFIGSTRTAIGSSALQSPCVSCICTTQGTKCASLKISSCTKLLAEVPRADIINDSVCTSQCGFFSGLQGTSAKTSPARFSATLGGGTRLAVGK